MQQHSGTDRTQVPPETPGVTQASVRTSAFKMTSHVLDRQYTASTWISRPEGYTYPVVDESNLDREHYPVEAFNDHSGSNGVAALDGNKTNGCQGIRRQNRDSWSPDSTVRNGNRIDRLMASDSGIEEERDRAHCRARIDPDVAEDSDSGSDSGTSYSPNDAPNNLSNADFDGDKHRQVSTLQSTTTMVEATDTKLTAGNQENDSQHVACKASWPRINSIHSRLELLLEGQSNRWRGSESDITFGNNSGQFMQPTIEDGKPAVVDRRSDWPAGEVRGYSKMLAWYEARQNAMVAAMPDRELPEYGGSAQRDEYKWSSREPDKEELEPDEASANEQSQKPLYMFSNTHKPAGTSSLFPEPLAWPETNLNQYGMLPPNFITRSVHPAIQFHNLTEEENTFKHAAADERCTYPYNEYQYMSNYNRYCNGTHPTNCDSQPANNEHSLTAPTFASRASVACPANYAPEQVTSGPAFYDSYSQYQYYLNHSSGPINNYDVGLQLDQQYKGKEARHPIEEFMINSDIDRNCNNACPSEINRAYDSIQFDRSDESSSTPNAMYYEPYQHHQQQSTPRELEAFSELFKQRRIKLGVTQADVGKALGALRIAGVGSLSQSTICRFESLTLSHNNMVALKPVLQAWLEEAEADRRRRLVDGGGDDELLDGGGGFGDSNSDLALRRKRTSITDAEKRALEAFFSVQPRPSSDKIAQIADKLKLRKNVVRVWFCNQRQKQKRMKFSTLGMLNALPLAK